MVKNEAHFHIQRYEIRNNQSFKTKRKHGTTQILQSSDIISQSSLI